jgi:16S rRNA (cytidine1402-2'-O)-methyltransferase
MEREKNKVKEGVLYLVGTPIGNLSDISERAIKVLGEVSFVAAEDTRNSAKLLMALGLHRELISYHEHNKRASGEKIVQRLLSGESCALITDAGMPAISDPGEDLVALCAESGVTVSVIPGACAAVSALALSGLPTSRFAFEGFLPVQKSEKKKRLEAVKFDDRTLIFYEAPHKLRATLSDMAEVFGDDRKISLCREITKINEEILRFTFATAKEYYASTEPRGEYVLIVEGCAEKSASGDESELISLSPEEHVAYYVGCGLERMDAIKRAAKDRGMTKSELYKILNTNK